MTKEIPLTKGYVALVDDEDYEKVSRLKWCALSSGTHVYGYRGRNTLMHRFIMDAPKGMVVDHINGNTLDNRRSNLRIITQQQNTMNQKMSKNNTSGYRGVTFCQGKWQARIWNKRKRIHLGTYEYREDAARAYDEAARKLYGDIARLNFPEAA